MLRLRRLIAALVATGRGVGAFVPSPGPVREEDWAPGTFR